MMLVMRTACVHLNNRAEETFRKARNMYTKKKVRAERQGKSGLNCASSFSKMAHVSKAPFMSLPLLAAGNIYDFQSNAEHSKGIMFASYCAVIIKLL